MTSLTPHDTSERRSIATTKVQRIGGMRRSKAQDHLAVEEPLEIRLNNESVAVTMRTPGYDFELAAGFLFTEGILQKSAQVGAISYCAAAEQADQKNIVNIMLVKGAKCSLDKSKRNFYATSSCGICGKAAIEHVKIGAPRIQSKLKVPRAVVLKLVDQLCAAQAVFEKTGGLHAAGLFSAKGKLLALREDVGRHNAVDKLIGHFFLNDLPRLTDSILMVSGRASFEIIQKAHVAGIPIVCAVSAPSSLAVQTAQECGMTLIGFLRGDNFNIYAGGERILL